MKGHFILFIFNYTIHLSQSQLKFVKLYDSGGKMQKSDGKLQHAALFIIDRIVHTAAWVYSGDINMRELQAKEAES